MTAYLRRLAAVVALLAMLVGCAGVEEGAPAQTAATEPAMPQTQPREELPAEPAEDAAAVWARTLESPEEGCVFVYDPGAREMIYCSDDPGDMLYPASITKLFTAWVALRFLAGDETVTVGWELGMLEPGSSSAFLALDSRLTVEDLIQGMLLPSGNDAALVLAAAVGRKLAGDKNTTAREAVALFVEEMNRAAEALGMDGTHFANPHGYHAGDHYSCPEDLGLMAALALEEPMIRRTVALSQVTVTAKTGQVHTWTNTNRLVRDSLEGFCPEALGLKTGYTDAAGYCLLGAFDSETPLVVGVFGSTDGESRYETALELYRSAKEAGVQTAALYGGVEECSGNQQYDGLTQRHIHGIEPEGTADIDG